MDEEDRKPVFRELAVCKQAAGCPYMVSYYGAFFAEVDHRTSLCGRLNFQNVGCNWHRLF